VAIFTFNDVPEAHAELQKEIGLAKVELRQGKVDVD
jgi:dolichyl-phosphate mannosyltransferase polypeptide 3